MSNGATITVTAAAKEPVTVVVGPYLLVQPDEGGSGDPSTGFMEVFNDDATAKGWRLVREETINKDKHLPIGEDAIDGSVVVNGTKIGASGKRAVSFGADTIAAGDHSFANGHATTANGNDSATEGHFTLTGSNSHAAHAEGYGTTVATADHSGSAASTVEFPSEWAADLDVEDLACNFEVKGTRVIPVGGGGVPDQPITTPDETAGLHAEGYETLAMGTVGAHAEGYLTISAGAASHTEGVGTTTMPSLCLETGGGGGGGEADKSKKSKVSKPNPPSEPYNEKTIGAHAEGAETISGGIGAHSEGYRTFAGGKGAHAEGYLTIAIVGVKNGGGGEVMAMEFGGEGGDLPFPPTIEIEAAPHAEGYMTEATGTSHAQGYQCLSQGKGAHSGGNYTDVGGEGSFGHGTNVSIGGGGYANFAACRSVSIYNSTTSAALGYYNSIYNGHSCTVFGSNNSMNNASKGTILGTQSQDTRGNSVTSIGNSNNSTRATRSVLLGNYMKVEYSNSVVAMGEKLFINGGNETLLLGQYNKKSPTYKSTSALVVGVGNTENTRRDGLVLAKMTGVLALPSATIASIEGSPFAEKAVPTVEYVDHVTKDFVSSTLFVSDGSMKPWPTYNSSAARPKTVCSNDNFVFASTYSQNVISVLDKATGATFSISGAPYTGDLFGWSIACTDDYLIVGMRTNPARYTGVVLIFSLANMTSTVPPTLHATVYNTLGHDVYNDYFGNAVAAAGTTVVIASNGNYSHIYDIATGTNTKVPVKALHGAVGATATHVVIGSYGTSSATVYSMSGGVPTLIATLTGAAYAGYNYFGFSVAITDNAVYVGDEISPDPDNASNPLKGGVYKFSLNGAQEWYRHGTAGQNAGYEIAATESRVVVGSSKAIQVYAPDGTLIATQLNEPGGTSVWSKFGLGAVYTHKEDIFIGAPYSGYGHGIPTVWSFKLRGEILRSDGTVVMDSAYTPTTANSIATSKSVASYVLTPAYGLSLPTTLPTISGTPWNDGGVVKITV